MIKSFIYRDPNASGNTPNLKSNHYDSLGSDREYFFLFGSQRNESSYSCLGLDRKIAEVQAPI